MQEHESAKSAKEIVMEYLEAVTERRDFESARSYLKDNVSYWSPLNSFDNAEASSSIISACTCRNWISKRLSPMATMYAFSMK